VAFLQWLLPRLGLRWPGFRKVRRQVARRLRRRAAGLGLAGLEAYRAYLEAHPDEWERAADCCRVTISRFYRDRGVFDALRARVLPELAWSPQGDNVLRAWSAGCASGEEPYSVVLAWELDTGHLLQGTRLQGTRPQGTRLEVAASDADAHLLERARRAVYPAASLRELPDGWREEAFTEQDDGTWRLRRRFREAVRWRCEDLRSLPTDTEERFDLVLCRNLAFTYFDEAGQRAFLDVLLGRLREGGALVVGSHEAPPSTAALAPWPGAASVYRKAGSR
jgi:chemotaxis protein methyltransferase CheR